MPAIQRGQVRKLTGGSWAYRYYDENGRRRQVGGFGTKGEASAAVSLALDRARLGPLAAARQDWTLGELVNRYLEQHQAAPATIARLRAMLAKTTAAFGDVPVRQLLPDEIGRWAKRLPEGHRHDAMVALRQVLNAAVRWKVIEENPANARPEPAPQARRDPALRDVGRGRGYRRRARPLSAARPLRGGDRPQAGGVACARAPRRRPRRPRRSGTPHILRRRAAPVRKDGALAEACPAAPARPRRRR
jgi:hypothetical protein